MSRGAYLARTRGGTQTGGRTQTTSQTGQSGGPAGMTFTESVSNPNIGVTQQEAQQQQQQFQTGDTSSTDTSGQTNVTTTDQDPIVTTQTGDFTSNPDKEKKRSLFESLLGGTLSGQLAKDFLNNTFKSTDTFYTDLLNKGLGSLPERDTVTYANLMADGLDESTLLDYANKNNLSPDQRIQLGEDLDLIKKNVLFQADKAGEYVEQYKAGQAKGLGQNISALFGQYDRPEGTLTRGEVIDKIGKAGMAYLDKTNPQLYDELQTYGTMQGVEKLASRSLKGLTNSPEDRRYAARIMEARALAADKQSRQDANMARTSPAFQPPLTQPGTPPAQPPGTTPPPTPPGATPVPAPPTGTTPTPFDYSQFPQFNMSDYARQGLGATPQFGDFNETLNRFFRFS